MLFMTKRDSLIEDFSHALLRFEEILREPKNPIVRDSAIKRFELVFDLAWKTVKASLEDYHNTTCVSPRTCFREAFRVGLVSHDEKWIAMTATRNYTVHTYHEVFAEKIYAQLPEALAMFQKLAQAITKTV